MKSRNAHQPEFVQAVSEVANSVFPLVKDNRDYQEGMILERLTEPDRVIVFRVTWEDSDGNVRVNRAWGLSLRKRFCQSFMSELFRHIGADADVPAGDIGVGSRDVGYLFGQYMRLTNQYEGAMTGKKLAYGGSAIRESQASNT